MFLESEYTFQEKVFTFGKGSRLDFPIHIHRAFEFYKQTKGSAEIVIDDKKYRLSAGQAVLIFPFQCHSYKSLENSEHQMSIFSTDLVLDFYDKIDVVPVDNMFHMPFDISIKPDNIFEIKAVVYSICGTFAKNAVYKTRDRFALEDNIISVLMFAEENFREQCLLKDVVKTIGYDYAYIAKKFKKSVGMTYNQYVNFLRIHESRLLLKNTTKSITAIAFACGYSSLRSFNRKFFEITGSTPSGFRNKEKKGIVSA